MAIRREVSLSHSAPRAQRVAAVSERDGAEIVAIPLPDVEVRAVSIDEIRPLTGDDIEKLKSFAGMWNDLDWDEMEASLEEIRRSSKTSPMLDDF